MSTQKIFAIRDNKVSAYLRPFVEPNEIQAVRGLQVALADEKIQLSMFPEDFDLYFLGEMDEITGVITPSEPPKFIVSAVSCKKMFEQQENKK